MNKIRFLASIIILAAAFFWAGRYNTELFTPSDIQSAEQAYSTSQYVMGDAAVEKISDAALYEYAGYRYTEGENPTNINFEHPPFGKYVLGLSWKLFGSMSVINFGLYISCLILFWFLSKTLLTKNSFRLAALGLLASVSLLPYYTFQSMLDIQLLFYTLAFLTGILFVKNQKKSIVISGLALGAYMSTKYFFPSAGIFIALLAWIAYRKKSTLHFIAPILIASGVYLASYTQYFIENPNPISFLQFEWYRFKWWTGDRTMPQFLLLSTIFYGKFKGWWDATSYEYASSWSLLWPVSLLGWLGSLAFVARKKSNLLLFMVFPLLQFALYLFGAAANERYLIQLIPFWILGSVMVVEKLYEIKNS